MPLVAYKLFRVRRDGTLGSLFINRHEVLPTGKWLRARCFPTKGFKVRAGWHALNLPKAPHLSRKGRAWFRVSLRGKVSSEARPERQGGLWWLASQMRIEERIT